jgi:hypothetical protein
MSLSALLIVFAEGIYGYLGQIDGFRQTHICDRSPRRLITTPPLYSNGAMRGHDTSRPVNGATVQELLVPRQAVWQPCPLAVRPASMFFCRRVLWRPRASPTTASPTHTDPLRVGASYLFPLRCLLSVPSLARTRRLPRSESSRPPARLLLSPGARDPILSPLSERGTTPPTLGNAPARAAPSPPPPRPSQW